MNSSPIYIQELSTPCGKLLLGSCDGRLCLCYWTNSKDLPGIIRKLNSRLGEVIGKVDEPVLEMSSAQLIQYFRGERQNFDIPIQVVGTDFQKQVWGALCKLPYGTTSSYLHLAKMLGRESAVRAVSNALKVNPLQVIYPCHRVVGKDGALTGYAGGLSAKHFLLGLEIKARGLV